MIPWPATIGMLSGEDLGAREAMVGAPHRVRRFPDIAGLLQPRSIAVIGASDQQGNLGGTAIRYLQRFGYPGIVWPVNPKWKTVAGLPCFPRPRDLPGPVDLAILAVPAGAVIDLVQECAEVGISHGVVWAGGFAETGVDGVKRQEVLAALCRETGFMLCGPNCIGVINTWLPMTASFASSLAEVDQLVPGNISMISQSGGIGSLALALAQQAGFGFRYVISSGNEAVLTVADYIHALVNDPGTKVIAVYLEGVSDGAKFLAALEEARAARKPVVILKGGATPASANAVVAHTGALAGEDRVWDAIFREQAVIRAYSQEELLDLVMFLSGCEADKLPKGNGVAVLTFGGGSGVLAADQAARSGLTIPALEATSQERLRPLVPPIASLINPIDLTPDTYNRPEWLARFAQALDVIAADPNIHTVLFQCGATAHRAQEMVDHVCALRRRTEKMVCVAWTLPPRVALERLPVEGVYPFPDPARAVKVIAQVVRYRAALSRAARPRATDPCGSERPFDWSGLVSQFPAGAVVPEHHCHRILAAAGLPIASGQLAASMSQATRAAGAVGYPVVLKGITAAITHRAAAGLVMLDIRSSREVRSAYRQLMERARALGVKLEGVYVQRMVRGGVEFLVSAFRDPQFGVFLACGAGGNLTEIIGDITLERAPVDEGLALQMLERLRLVEYVAGSRGAADPRPVAEFLVRFSHVAASAPWRRFVLEVNPVKWNQEGVVAVDGLLVVEEL